MMYIQGACLMHQYHLAVQSGLSFTDTALKAEFLPAELNGFCKYFASLAAVANSWREKASQVLDRWHAQFGADRLARQYPQHVISGRWGSVDAAESFYLARGRNRIQQVLLAVISKHMKAGRPTSADAEGRSKAPDAAGVGENQQTERGADAEAIADGDDSAAYRIKLSKWYSTTFHAISNPVFWFVLEVSHRAREPLRHFFHFLQRHSSDKRLLRLVTQRLACFRAEWVLLLLNMPVWLDEALQNSGCQNLSASTQGKLKMLGCKLVFKLGHAFEMRIVKRVDRLLGSTCLAFWRVIAEMNRVRLHGNVEFVALGLWVLRVLFSKCAVRLAVRAR